MDSEALLRNATQHALTDLGASDVAFAVEWPADMSHGDYAINAAMAAAKTLGKNPRELACELAPKIQHHLGDHASSVSVAGPGFINVTLSKEAIINEIKKAVSEERAWGTNALNENKRIIIEFSNTNAFKEMHIGHFMSTIIGEAVARITESSGATVARDSYGGDVGPHVAKALWSLKKAGITDPATAEEIGKAYAHGSRAYDESPEAKAEIDTLNVAIYEGTDAELMELWRKGRDVSMDAFKEIHRLLDTHFDYYFFESETAPIGLRVVKDQLARGVFEESEGAVIYKGEKVGLHTLVFITSRGTPTYEAKDVGLAYLKEERWPSDESIIITANEQIGHFKVFLAALTEIAPLLAAKTRHVSHGFLRLTEGKMSSREGNIISAASLIREAIEKASERNADSLIAEQVGMGAIKYSVLKQSAGSDIIFDFEKSLSLEGDSGPYLQYALVRAKSIIAQTETDDEAEIADAPAEPYRIERFIARYPGTVLRAQQSLEPHHIAQYLTQLASEWNSFYAAERIIGGTHEAYKLRVAKAFVSTMQNGLHLLGIPTPEKM